MIAQSLESQAGNSRCDITAEGFRDASLLIYRAAGCLLLAADEVEANTPRLPMAMPRMMQGALT